MSQYYPQQGPAYPPPQHNPESDYYYDDDYEYEEYDDSSGNSTMRLGLSFLAGGCLAALCIGLCVLAVGVLWVADPSLGISEPTPIPGSNIGLSFDDPAFSTESVVNDKNVKLTILEVNRNAVVEAIPQVEGREVLIVTIELVNLGKENTNFNERDFQLLNQFQDAYEPALGAIAGALGRGTLPPNEGLEGRLVYEVTSGEVDLRLFWQAPDSAPRFIYLQ
ncbi:MAG: DUF4352 domain-containing protein [Chloroflexi bacterium]|nr:MAG: DUF4352 domain-containing protein [Chloroflexota bacterium]